MGSIYVTLQDTDLHCGEARHCLPGGWVDLADKEEEVASQWMEVLFMMIMATTVCVPSKAFHMHLKHLHFATYHPVEPLALQPVTKSLQFIESPRSL